jgi:hypothetical protein
MGYRSLGMGQGAAPRIVPLFSFWHFSKVLTATVLFAPLR